ncbi:MAG: methyltransferase domain-containing protein [Patulibacter minatonensis]
MSHESYDQVAYLSRPIPSTDPQLLSTMAHLFGLDAADPADCDVLELGCGDGGNLLSLAGSYRGIRAVGFDPAQEPIGRGREAIARTGITNLTLHHDEAEVDLTESADYVLAHGVLTWVDPGVREAVIASAARAARPGALVNFSYRAFPYAYYELPAREAAQFAIRQARERAAERGEVLTWRDELEVAKERLRWIVELTETEVHKRALADRLHEWEHVIPDWNLFHDDLSDELHPFRAEDVAREAAAHGLTYVGEVRPEDVWQLRIADSEIKDRIRALGGDSAIAQRQVADDLVGGGFHSSLFVKGDAAPFTEPATRGRDLYVRQYIHNRVRGELDSDRENAAIAQVVREHTPGYVRASEIAAELGDDQETIDAELLRLHAMGLVRVTTCPPNLPAEPGEFPRAVPAGVEDMLAGDDQVATRFHTPMRVEATSMRALFLLCDGTRDRAALARDLPGKAAEFGLTADLDAVLANLDYVLEEAALVGLLEAPQD